MWRSVLSLLEAQHSPLPTHYKPSRRPLQDLEAAGCGSPGSLLQHEESDGEYSDYEQLSLPLTRQRSSSVGGTVLEPNNNNFNPSDPQAQAQPGTAIVLDVAAHPSNEAGPWPSPPAHRGSPGNASSPTASSPTCNSQPPPQTLRLSDYSTSPSDCTTADATAELRALTSARTGSVTTATTAPGGDTHKHRAPPPAPGPIPGTTAPGASPVVGGGHRRPSHPPPPLYGTGLFRQDSYPPPLPAPPPLPGLDHVGVQRAGVGGNGGDRTARGSGAVPPLAGAAVAAAAAAGGPVSARGPSVARYEDLRFVQQIGEGGFGRVYFGTWKGQRVAIKLAHPVQSGAGGAPHPEGLVREFGREVAAMSALPPHKNVLQLLAACTEPPALALVTHYCPAGSLYALLHAQPPPTVPLLPPPPRPPGPPAGHANGPPGPPNPGAVPTPATPTPAPASSPHPPSPSVPPPAPQSPSWLQLLSICHGVAQGMTWLHRHSILHRDLKSANILLDEGGVAKIADFGLAKIYSGHRQTLTGGLGTYQWAAPEVLAHQRYSEKADVYSFGIVLWECLTKKLPYEGMTAVQAAVSVVNAGLRPDMPRDAPPAIVELIRACWAAIPEQRPSFAQIELQLAAMLQQARGGPVAVGGASSARGTGIAAAGTQAAAAGASAEVGAVGGGAGGGGTARMGGVYNPGGRMGPLEAGAMAGGGGGGCPLGRGVGAAAGAPGRPPLAMAVGATVV